MHGNLLDYGNGATLLSVLVPLFLVCFRAFPVLRLLKHPAKEGGLEA